MARRFFLIAGEASGDRLGAALMAGLRELEPEVEFAGIGGPLMEAQGLTSLFPMEELSVMGFSEVLPRLRHLFRRRDEAVAAILAAKPDALITIDSPDFCLRVAAKVRAADPSIRTVHYVAPSVWAWRPGRAARMARHIDHVLALLPFEPAYMLAAGMDCDFVGHPAVAEPVASDDEMDDFRERHGIGDAPLVLVLPGSRQSELARLGPVFGEAMARLAGMRPDVRFVTVAAGDTVARQLEHMATDWPGNVVVIDPRHMSAETFAEEKRGAFGAADVALAASGTVSLELAAAATPMVIAYDMARLSWLLMNALRRTDTVTLVNLVSDTRTVPEFLGPACQPRPIAEALSELLESGPARAEQVQAMATTMQRLGKGGEPPGLRAARSVLSAVEAGKARSA